MAYAVFQGRYILVVEDEFMIAESLCFDLERHGAVVVGPAPSMAPALALITSANVIDAAVVDINLGGQLAFPVAQALTGRRIPFVFTSGYDQQWLRTQFPNAPLCEKPFDLSALARTLQSAIAATWLAGGVPAQAAGVPSANPAIRSPWA